MADSDHGDLEDPKTPLLTNRASASKKIVLHKAAKKSAGAPPPQLPPKPKTSPKQPAEHKSGFCSNLRSIHADIVALDGYTSFMVFKYFPLSFLKLTSGVSMVIVAYVLIRRAEGFTPPRELDPNSLDGVERGCLMTVGLLNLFGRLAPFLLNLYIDRLKESLQITQATAVLAKIFDLPHDAVLSTPTGEFGQLLGKVYRNLDTLLPALYGSILPVFAETLIGVVFISYAYGVVGLVQGLLFVCYTVAAWFIAKKKADRMQEATKVFLTEYGKILGLASSYERALYFGNVRKEVEDGRQTFERLSVQFTEIKTGEHKEGMALMAITLVLTGAFMSLVFATHKHDLSGLEFAALAFYFVMYVGSTLEPYALGISNLRSAVVEYETLLTFLTQLSDVADVPNAEDLIIAPGETVSIEFENISFDYGDRKILDNVSFVLKKQQRLGLVGSSGCGKSTILRLLLRFYKPSGGRILVNGKDIAFVTRDSLRKLFSVVAQDAQLFNGTLRENIAYGKLGSSDEHIIAVAQKAGLQIGGGMAPLPTPSPSSSDGEGAKEGADGDQKVLALSKDCGERGAKLSGGQQQRVSLARALLKDGCVFLLDEPTTGLDGVVAKRLAATMDELSKTRTTICISHHLEDFRGSDLILYLDGGRIVEEGDYEELMGLKGRFWEQVEARKRG